MRFCNIIFDLDGTLIDSLPGIEASARHAVEQCQPDRTPPQMRNVIGPPVRTMFAQLWPDLTAAELDAMVIAFRSHYDTVGCLASPLYPAVPETLLALRQAGAKMLVLTNKPSLPTRLILEERGISAYFQRVISPDSRTPLFTRKSQGAEALRSEFDLNPAATIVIGDGIDDYEAAEACGFAFANAGYGYGSAARAAGTRIVSTLETFSDIVKVVL